MILYEKNFEIFNFCEKFFHKKAMCDPFEKACHTWSHKIFRFLVLEAVAILHKLEFFE